MMDSFPGFRNNAMNADHLLARVAIDPGVCSGRPRIRGHRIWVSLILDLRASGMSIEEILHEYEGLERDDVVACVAYGAELAKGEAPREFRGVEEA